MRERTFQIRLVAAGGLWLSAMLSTSGCLFQKKPPGAYVPPPVRPPAPVALKQPPLIADPVPEVEIAVVELPDSGPAIMPSLPPPVAQPAPVRPRPPAPQPPKPAPPPPEAPQTLPRITQILTAQQIRENNQQLDEFLNFVTEALKTAGKKNLTADQRDIVERITAFQKQAVQAREDDLVTAVNYARRADFLAIDLLKHLP